MLYFTNDTEIEHGGCLNRAIQRFGGTKSEWLDLSTGINPNPYPCENIPSICWQHLPSDYSGLIQAAKKYYKTNSMEPLPVAGLQSILNWLPKVLIEENEPKILIQKPAYEEHQRIWSRYSRHCKNFESAKCLENDIINFRPKVVVIVNPNNPSSEMITAEEIVDWSHQLKRVGGYLFIDEAFMDVYPNMSLLNLDGSKQLIEQNVIVYRSIGKFFGLAGARVGFLYLNQNLRDVFSKLIEPWHISHPSKWIVTQALNDEVWQHNAFQDIVEIEIKLTRVLKNWIEAHSELMDAEISSSKLFVSIKHPKAHVLHSFLAENKIWSRLVAKDQIVRLGLPNRKDLLQLTQVLTHQR